LKEVMSMKRFVPIVRDDINGIFDRDVTGKIVVVNMESLQVSRMLVEILENFTKIERKRGVVLSYSRPMHNLVRILKRFWVPIKDLIMVDGTWRFGKVRNRPIGSGLSNPQVLDVLEPFSVNSLLERIMAATLIHRARKKVAMQVTDGNRDLEMENEIEKAEMVMYGDVDGVEWSIMKHRARERAREVVWKRTVGEDEDRGRDWESVYATDFLVIENFQELFHYFSNDDIDELIRGLRGLIASGLIRSVIVLLDRRQYFHVVDNLKEFPDLRFELRTSSYQGVTGYRLVPGDNGP
jgi:hypothetical protein